MSTGIPTKTPAEWCRIEGVEILDPDGWRGANGRPWNDPITLAEFQERLVVCTQRSVPLQESPITGPQYPLVGQLSGVTIGGTSGPWPAGEPILATPTAKSATEHHVGTLDLSGEGNEPEFTVEALHDEICRAFGAIHSPDNLAEILARHGWVQTGASRRMTLDAMRLIADTRKLMAEEIAVAITKAGDERSPDRHHRDEEKGDHGSTRYASYLDAASVAREIGGKG